MILVIDLENTCQEGRPVGYPSDTIEIGAVWATPQGQVLDKFETVVQTETPITAFCTELTSLTQFDVDAGLSYPVAMQALTEFATRYPNREWASWGVGDLRSFEIDCAKHTVENPLKDWAHRNLKIEFAYANADDRCGLALALKIMGIERDGRKHRALPDALNTAKLLPYIAKAKVMRDSLWHREEARREALWSVQAQEPGEREKAFKTLSRIVRQDRKAPIGDGAKLTTAHLRKGVRIVPASAGTIAHVIESEIPQPWRERFQQASIGSTKGSQDTAYAHDWLKFLDLWDRENDYRK